MKKFALIVSAAAFLALPVASAPAADIPEINCGIVSCTYPIEKKLEYVNETGGGLVEDAVNCATGTVEAYWRAINGYPQMYYCEIG